MKEKKYVFFLFDILILIILIHFSVPVCIYRKKCIFMSYGGLNMRWIYLKNHSNHFSIIERYKNNKY